MWSYFHRRESTDLTQSDLQRRIHLNADSEIDDFDLFESIMKHMDTNNFVSLLIPDCHDAVNIASVWQDIKGESWPGELPESWHLIPQFVQDELRSVHKLHDKVKTLIPLWARLKQIKNNFSFVDYNVVDYSRDGYHFGAETCELVGKKICALISTRFP
jgi:hypothetical protein